MKGVRTLFQSNDCEQMVCPTGNCANLISWVTLHTFLKVPTFNRGREMKAPDGTLGETLQNSCKNLKVLLVDERSLIGATAMGWMEFMCCYSVASQTGRTRFFVFPSHEEEANHNNKNLREANKMHPVVKLMAKEKGIHSSSVDTNQAGGLINTPYLCKGAKVMLTANLNVKQGLFNGATGHVVDTI